MEPVCVSGTAVMGPDRSAQGWGKAGAVEFTLSHHGSLCVEYTLTPSGCDIS